MTEKFDKELRQAYRKMRVWIGISQGALGAKVGLSAATISRWENGRGELSENELSILGEIMDSLALEKSEKEKGALVGLTSESIKRTRRRYGITQVELAKAARMSQASISLIESGHVQINEWLEDIGKALDSLTKDRLPEQQFSSLASLLRAQPLPVQTKEKSLEEKNEELKDQIEVIRGEVASLKSQIDNYKELWALQDQRDSWFQPLHEKILALEERAKAAEASRDQLLDLLGIKTKEGILHWKADSAHAG